jgi:thiamine biosynthesis lipoprotein
MSSFPALGSTATIAVTDDRQHDQAIARLRAELDAIDLAASRFRPDSEVSRLNAAKGSPVPASPLFLDAIDAALQAARLTNGLVDPTVGRALEAIGYDRDFAEVDKTGGAIRIQLRPVPGWSQVRLDRAASTVRVPPGVQLDLGATAKALCADRAAQAIAESTGAGVLISLGGDIAVAGSAPDGGWSIRITDDHSEPPDTARGPVVSICSGGLATSSTTVRRWSRGGKQLHHLIDPARSAPVDGHWRTVSVAAGSCLDANIASCAAVILGDSGPAWLEARGLPARLVDALGQVMTVGGWPHDGAGPQAGAPREGT